MSTNFLDSPRIVILVSLLDACYLLPSYVHPIGFGITSVVYQQWMLFPYSNLPAVHIRQDFMQLDNM
jgi:hypothetical protein